MSVQRNTDKLRNFKTKEPLTKLANLTPAINSNLGRVRTFKGVTCDHDISNKCDLVVVTDVGR